MEKIIKNINHSSVLPLAMQIDYLDGQIVSKTLAQNIHHTLTLFAFDVDEEISSHESTGDAMIVVLDGVAKVNIANQEYLLHAGETIVMPAKIPHAVYAYERFKMMLIVLFVSNQENKENL